MSSNSREKIEEQDINNNKLEDKKIKNENTLNLNQTDDNILEDDGVENLRFNSKLFLDVDKNDINKESIDLGIKFSIDYAPQQRLHEYLNNDLINELDNNFSNPHTPITPIYNNENNKNENNNNDDNKEKFNIEDIPKIDLGNEKEEEKEIENQIQNQNKNENENFNNQIQTPLSLLKVNKFDYTKMKFNIPILNNMNNNINNINNQNKEKPKKHFEIRAGDWTCYDCNNLNFAFRIKCNRCGLPKEVSLQKFKMGLIKNLNIQSNSNIMFYPHNFKDKNQ